MEFVHKSVLFNEAVEALKLDADKIIVDATAGGGGHTFAIAQRVGKVIAVDRDPNAVQTLKNRFKDTENVFVVHDNYSNIKNIVGNLNIDKIDGLLLDLGVSSFQLDTAQRGFSFHKDAPLDMRMSKSGMSAADVVNTYSEQELANIIYRYGEEKYSRSIASNIVKYRQNKPIETTFELVDIIKSSMPQRAMRDSHPARRTFQAIRIEVNGELDELSSALDSAFSILSPGGRIAVITFHSLEDRIVKERFAQWSKGCTCPKEFPVCVCGNKPKGKALKAIVPSEKELEDNPRARSSRLRTFEKY
ncbi:MAG: 16S rRNA (cytosine(1402)-N(4))-methyltransferase RsmH [Clostridiales bacterium]|nr:16S rRNA (cytosine(1402)-N(4))-methyltransferase RsmH [Clostridiales bacterium]